MENLFTDGSEFKLPNGRRYRGYYHIHPVKGAMVGAVHVNQKHSLLQPVNSIVNKRVEKNKAAVPSRERRSSVLNQQNRVLSNQRTNEQEQVRTTTPETVRAVPDYSGY